jgi:hypothetical protein
VTSETSGTMFPGSLSSTRLNMSRTSASAGGAPCPMVRRDSLDRISESLGRRWDERKEEHGVDEFDLEDDRCIFDATEYVDPTVNGVSTETTADAA